MSFFAGNVGSLERKCILSLEFYCIALHFVAWGGGGGEGVS